MICFWLNHGSNATCFCRFLTCYGCFLSTNKNTEYFLCLVSYSIWLIQASILHIASITVTAVLAFCCETIISIYWKLFYLFRSIGQFTKISRGEGGGGRGGGGSEMVHRLVTWLNLDATIHGSCMQISFIYLRVHTVSQEC